MAALELQLVGAHLFVGSAQGFMALSLALVFVVVDAVGAEARRGLERELERMGAWCRI